MQKKKCFSKFKLIIIVNILHLLFALYRFAISFSFSFLSWYFLQYKVIWIATTFSYTNVTTTLIIATITINNFQLDGTSTNFWKIIVIIMITKIKNKFNINQIRLKPITWIYRQIKATSRQKQPSSCEPIIVIEFLSERRSDWKCKYCCQILEAWKSE